MVIVNWKLRPKGDKLNPYVKYKNDPNLFSLKVNHGGRFSYVYGPKRTRAPRHVYKGGNADWFNDIDVDGFFVIEVLDKGHEPLSKDIDVLDLLSYVRKFKLIELFIKHMVDSCVLDTSVIDLDHEDNRVSDGLESGNVGIENDNVEELDPLFSYLNTNHHIRQSSSDDNDKIDDTEESDESKDSDFECDIEDRIDDVYVDMEMFTKNTDPSEEWVGSTDDIDPNDDEAKRKKALRKLSKGRKPVDGQLYTKNYYALKKRKKDAAELYDRMVKDGKLSKAGKIITYLKCSEKGHNSISCMGKRSAQSTERPMPTQ
nr:transposase, MuDR [Tanacetum cinerariifolium]